MNEIATTARATPATVSREPSVAKAANIDPDRTGNQKIRPAMLPDFFRLAVKRGVSIVPVTLVVEGHHYPFDLAKKLLCWV